MKSCLKTIIKNALFYSGAIALYRWIFHRQSVLILVYHRTAPANRVSNEEASFNVMPEVFERQMRYLARRYTVVPLEEVVSRIVTQRRFRRGTVVLTFDDGRRDNLEIAFPILRTLKLPATFFVTTSRVDNPGDNYFGWDDARMLVRNGMSVGSHSDSHKRLTLCSRDELLKELHISRAKIAEATLQDFIPFSYPYGETNSFVLQAVSENQYACAVTTKPGFVLERADIFSLPRLQIDAQATATVALFAAQLVRVPRQVTQKMNKTEFRANRVRA